MKTKTETFAFRAPSGTEKKVHLIADYYGKSYLDFSNKCVFCLEKLEEIVLAQKEDKNGNS